MKEVNPPESTAVSGEDGSLSESYYEEPVWKRFYAFLLGPALLAAAALAVFTVMSLLTADDSEPGKLLEAMRGGGQHRRWQAAFALTKFLQPSVEQSQQHYVLENDRHYQEKLGQVRILLPQLLEIWNDPRHGDVELQRFLALALSYLADQRALPSLAGALAAEDVELVHYALVAIATTADSVRGQGGNEPVDLGAEVESAVLAASRRHEPDIRATAIFSLSILGTQRAKGRMAEALADAAPAVTWNAAFGLARYGDTRGQEVISEILDRGPLFEAVGVDLGRQRDLFLNAVRSAGMVQSPMLWKKLKKIADHDRDLKARDEAKKLLTRGPPGVLNEG
jgi:hypothetical protein